MPHSRAHVTTSAARSRADVTIPADKGVLTTVLATDFNYQLQPADCWAEIGLCLNGQTVTGKCAVLATGYIGEPVSLGWTGRLLLEPEMDVYLSTWSSVAADVMLAIKTEP